MIVLAVIVILILILMILPVRYRIHADNIEDEFNFLVLVTYGMGIISFSYNSNLEEQKTQFKALGFSLSSTGRGSDIYREDKTFKEKIDSIKEKRKLYKHMLEAVKEIIERFLMKNTVLSLRLGTADPANTGMLMGLVASISNYFNSTFRFEPIFSGDNLEVDFSVRGAILPIVPLVIVIKHLFTYGMEKAAFYTKA